LHIHQLRVTTKKLRSICGLLESLHTGLVAKEVLLPIRKVYKSGGRVRDLQVLLGIVREYEAQLEEKYADWEIFLGGQMALHKAEFRYRAGRLAPDTSQRIAGEMAAALRAVPQEAFGKLLHSWVDQMAAQIIALLDGPKTDEDLHTARARVKDILYVLQWVQSCGIDHPFLPRLEEIRLMGSQLGDWHDRVVLLENLHDFQEECTQLSLPCNPSTTYEHLQGQVIRDRDQWLEGREAALRALFGTQK
jgi:CHAD domain-containing protein